MAKIDVSKIEGYDTMSAEEKLAALENYEMSYDGYVEKATLDKVMSEVASKKKELEEWKKKHNDLLSDDEKRKIETEEFLENLKKENEALKLEKSVSEYKASYLGLGYSEELALQTAQALASGDTAKVLELQKQHQEVLAQAIKKDIYKTTPRPIDGGSANATFSIDQEIEKAKENLDFAKMSALIRQKTALENQ